MNKHRLYLSSLFLISLAVLSGCWNAGPNAAAGIAGGAVVGAGTGAIIGNQSGSASEGALVGGVGGAVDGGALGASRDAGEKATAAEDEFIARQKLEMEKQKKEVEDLQRQKYHDDYYRSRYQNGAE